MLRSADVWWAAGGSAPRRAQILFLSSHWFACAFYLLARIESSRGFAQGNSWVGRAWFRFETLDWGQRCAPVPFRQEVL